MSLTRAPRQRIGPALLLGPLPQGPGRVRGVMAGPGGGRLVDVNVEHIEAWNREGRDAALAGLGLRRCVFDPVLPTVRSQGESEDGESVYVIGDAVLGVGFRPFTAKLASAGGMPLGLALALTSSVAQVVEKIVLLAGPAFRSGIEFDSSEWWVSFEGGVRSHLLLTAVREVRVAETPGQLREGFWHLSPEHIRGHRGDAGSDVWGLGAVLFRLLTDRRPFLAGTPIAELQAILSGTRTPLANLRPDLPADVERLLDRCFARDPAARPDLATLRHALASLAALDEGWTPARVASVVRDHFGDEARAADLAVEEAARTAFDVAEAEVVPLVPVDVTAAFERWRRRARAPFEPQQDITRAAPEPLAWGRDGRPMVHARSAAGDPFYVDRDVVTAGEYRRFLDESGHPVGAFDRDAADGTGAFAPAVNVGPDDAAAFARWAGKRLPTVNESIGAARLRPQLFAAGVWQWTTTTSHLGFFVVGGVYRDRPLDVPHPENQAFEGRAARDVGFRCAADLEAPGRAVSVTNV